MPNTNLEVETKQFHAFLYYFMVEVKLIRTIIHSVILPLPNFGIQMLFRATFHQIRDFCLWIRVRDKLSDHV